MAKEVKAPEEEGCALWVVTFGDAMSLLVTFFVMLVSFADFEEHALQETFGALKGGLRAVPLPMAATIGGLPVDEMAKNANQSEEADPSANQSSKKLINAQDDARIIRSNSSDYYVHLLANGISLVINRQAVFEPGTATLKDLGHEVWAVAHDLMQSVNNEVRVAITLPENIVVRMDEYSTSWGLGIEQALAIQDLLSENSPNGHEQLSTSVKVVKTMPRTAPSAGMVEVLFVGYSELQMKNMPRKILREAWREMPKLKTEQDDGQDG